MTSWACWLATRSRRPTDAMLLTAAALAFALMVQQLTAVRTFRLFPYGRVRALAGAALDDRSWLLTPTRAERLLRTHEAVGLPVTVYLADQCDAEGNPVEAGHFRTLELRRDGVYVTDATWQALALARMSSGEYVYVAPVFSFDAKTLEVEELVAVELSRVQIIHGLGPLPGLVPAAQVPQAALA